MRSRSELILSLVAVLALGAAVDVAFAQGGGSGIGPAESKQEEVPPRGRRKLTSGAGTPAPLDPAPTDPVTVTAR